MRDYENLKEILCAELEPIAKKRSMVRGDLDPIYKLIVSIEKLDKIMEMEGEDYSKDGGWRAEGDYSRRRDSYDDNSRRGMNDSYAGRRGTHYVRGHYSRAAEDMADEIEEIMNDPQTSQEDKMVLRKAMGILGK